MSGYLGTNILVRYLTGQPPPLADQAARIIDTVEGLRLTDVVLTEAAYVLASVYHVPRHEVVDALVDFVQKQNILIHGMDKGLAIEALRLCRPSGRVSFADALLWAAARSAPPHRVYTLDERFPTAAIETRSSP